MAASLGWLKRHVHGGPLLNHPAKRGHGPALVEGEVERRAASVAATAAAGDSGERLVVSQVRARPGWQ